MFKKLYCEDGKYISYKKVVGSRGSLIFFAGFNSNMNGTKATTLYEYCTNNDLSLILFDYFGHGCSSGKFKDCNMTDWYSNCLNVIDKLTSSPQIIIGSSMGAWLMLLVALAKPKIVKGLIGIASAPDFTHNLILEKLTDIQKDKLIQQSEIDFFSYDKTCSYTITKNLLDDSEKYLLLQKKSINITAQVTFMHGMNDQEVPYQTSITLAEKIISHNVSVRLIKSAAHNMSDKISLYNLFHIIEDMIQIQS